MASLLTLTFSQPTRELAAGDLLVREGDPGGDLYVLESGALSVERQGTVIARLTQPGTLVGEMSVLTQSPNSATVRADGKAVVRVVKDAIQFINRQPEIAVHIAGVLAQRLNATSKVLADLRTESGASPEEKSRMGRVLAALLGPSWAG